MQINRLLVISLTLSVYVGLIEAVPLSREELKGFIAYDNGTDTIQLLVPSQFGMENGYASCGYQASYNGLAIRDILQLTDQTQRAAALTNLKNDIDSRNKKFSSTESPWRATVINSHVQDELRPAIEEQIMLMYKGAKLIHSKDQNVGIFRTLSNEHLITFPAPSEENAVPWDKLRSEVRSLSRVLGEKSQKANNGSSYTIPAAVIKKQLRKRLRERRDDPNIEDKQSFVELLEPGMLESLIDFKDITVSVPSGHIGNWIDSHDIELVLRDAEKADMKNIFITGNNQLQGSDALTKDTQLFDPDLLDPITKKPIPTAFNQFVDQFMSDKGSVTGIFCIYLKSPSKNKIDTNADQKTIFNNGMGTSSDGHWVTFVAHREGSIRQFLMANSCSSSCIEHYRIKELKCLLQGDVTYAIDGRFDEWIKESYPASSPIVAKLLNRLKENSPQFVQKYPFSVGLLGGIVAGAAFYWLLDRYTKGKSNNVFRSPEQAAGQSVAAIAVH